MSSAAFTKLNTEVIDDNIGTNKDLLANVCIIFVIIGVLAVLTVALVSYIISGMNVNIHNCKNYKTNISQKNHSNLMGCNITMRQDLSMLELLLNILAGMDGRWKE